MVIRKVSHRHSYQPNHSHMPCKMYFIASVAMMFAQILSEVKIAKLKFSSLQSTNDQGNRLRCKGNELPSCYNVFITTNLAIHRIY